MSVPVAIHKITLIDPATLAPAAYNPRRISRRGMAALKQSIAQHGFVEPVVVQNSTRMIIGGHQRVEALMDLCRERGVKPPKIPAAVIEIDDRRAKILNLALNKVGGEFDDHLLASLFAEFESTPLNDDELLGSGFTTDEVAALLSAADIGPETGGETGSFAASVTLSIKFDTVEERDATKALLDERAARENKKQWRVLRDLFG